MLDILAAADGNNWTSILAAVVSIFGTSFVGLIAYIFHETRKDLQNDMQELKATVHEQLESLNKHIDRNSKHIDSVMASYWPILWRINGMEDHLEREGKYQPPRMIGEAEARFRGKEKD